MRSHRRRGPLEHVLVAGTVAELDSIRALLALLPDTVYGQVLVETRPDEPLPAVAAPPRVTVSRAVCLDAAIAAWAAEWIPEESRPDREVSIWCGNVSHEDLPIVAGRLERL